MRPPLDCPNGTRVARRHGRPSVERAAAAREVVEPVQEGIAVLLKVHSSHKKVV